MCRPHFLLVLQLQGHRLSRIHEEYVQFAGHKQRKLDRMYIEDMDPMSVLPLLSPPHIRPPWFKVKTLCSPEMRPCLLQQDADDAMHDDATHSDDAASNRSESPP